MVSGKLAGVQHPRRRGWLAPLNVAWTSLRGAQISIINVGGKSRGLQLGLLNIASEDEGLVPVGLINVVGDGHLSTTVWSSGSSLFNVGLRMGGKRVQGLLGIGVQPGDDQDARFSVFWGLGLHASFDSGRPSKC